MSKKSLILFFSTAAFLFVCLLLSYFLLLESASDIEIANRFSKPSRQNWLGTDQLGRDFFALLFVGAVNSCFFASIALIIGSTLGTLFAFLRLSLRFSSHLLEEINKLFFAIPVILTAILFYTFLQSSWASLIAISLFNIPIFYYLTKNIASRILVKEYSLFSISIGNSKWNIYRLHIFPQLYNSWVVQFSIQWGIAILMEAGLSYLGLGIRQPTPSLGRILYENRSFYELQAGLVLYPGLVLFLLVLFFQYFADSLKISGEKQF
jgi:peptide/nickel transport system permease protein